jgi:NAD(P)-dependent dehydrogenase (short-subunit alcohol dehydrogenase family)
MHIKGATALVTGANRGLGAAFAHSLLASGATTVYGGARSDFTSPEPGIVPVRLDVTDPEQVAAAADRLTDVNLVVNNAGIYRDTDVLSGDFEADLRAMLETNTFGLLSVSRAFAPILAANGGGALVNILSVASWRSLPGFDAYSTSKTAAWMLTNSLRLAMRPDGTLVVAVHAGFIDTDMAAGVDAPKVTTDDVVSQVLAAVEDGTEEVLVDDRARYVKARLSEDITSMYPR